jgi:sec-independent protein translocase protein TatA
LPIQEALMFRLGVPELLILAVIVLFLFGGRKLPEMGKGIGEGIKNFKKSIKGDEEKEKHA